jgi:hypothetical protein
MQTAFWLFGNPHGLATKIIIFFFAVFARLCLNVGLCYCNWCSLSLVILAYFKLLAPQGGIGCFSYFDAVHPERWVDLAFMAIGDGKLLPPGGSHWNIFQ